MERRLDSDDRKALRLLRSYAGRAKSGRVVLSAEYMRDVRRCEALPENQSGRDKTWVERSRRRFREHFARARRAR
jgi:hypothetical protein